MFDDHWSVKLVELRKKQLLYETALFGTEPNKHCMYVVYSYIPYIFVYKIHTV